jgi:hypothetical protein
VAVRLQASTRTYDRRSVLALGHSRHIGRDRTSDSRRRGRCQWWSFQSAPACQGFTCKPVAGTGIQCWRNYPIPEELTAPSAHHRLKGIRPGFRRCCRTRLATRNWTRRAQGDYPTTSYLRPLTSRWAAKCGTVPAGMGAQYAEGRRQSASTRLRSRYRGYRVGVGFACEGRACKFPCGPRNWVRRSRWRRRPKPSGLGDIVNDEQQFHRYRMHH